MAVISLAIVVLFVAALTGHLPSMPSIDTLMAMFRGWFPSWQSQMRTWGTFDFVLWGSVVASCLMTTRSLLKK